MKYILSFMFVFLSMTLIAQTSINDYKYVVVPKSYEFSQEQDQYQLNSLSKFNTLGLGRPTTYLISCVSIPELKIVENKRKLKY